MASPTVTKLRNDLAVIKTKYSGALRKVRSNPSVKKGSDIAVEVAGAAIAAYVATSPKMARVAGIETPLLIGGGLVAYSMFSKKNQINHMAGLMGAGMLNAYVFQKVVQYRGFVTIHNSNITSKAA